MPESNVDFLFPGMKYVLVYESNRLFDTGTERFSERHLRQKKYLEIECEFIKFFDASILERAKEYFMRYFDEDSDDVAEHAEQRTENFIGTLRNNDGTPIKLDFENPLYPYFNTTMFADQYDINLTQTQLQNMGPKSIGLFKFIRCLEERTGQNNNTRCADPNYKIDALFINPTQIVTDRKDKNINYDPVFAPNKTKLWVNLDKVKIKMDEAEKLNIIDRMKRVRVPEQIKALKESGLPEDIVTHEISPFIKNEDPWASYKIPRSTEVAQSDVPPIPPPRYGGKYKKNSKSKKAHKKSKKSKKSKKTKKTRKYR